MHDKIIFINPTKMIEISRTRAQAEDMIKVNVTGISRILWDPKKNLPQY